MARETLHNLPPEIILQIYRQLPDQKCFESMMLVCSKFHTVYRENRRGLLSQLVPKIYGDLMPDALAAIRSEGLSFQDHEEEAIALLDKRRRSKELMEPKLPKAIQPKLSLSMGEVIKLLRLNKTIHFFLNGYVKPMNVSSNEPITNSNSAIVPFSDMETRRFSRALLRIQTYSNIFGKREASLDVDNCQFIDFVRPSDQSQRKRVVAPTIELTRTKELGNAVMFGPMPPWEMEEFACVWTYLREISLHLVNPVTKILIHHFAPDSRASLEKLQEKIRGVTSKIDELTPLLIGPMFMYRLMHAQPLNRCKMIMANAHESQNKMELDLFTSKPALRPGVEYLLDPVEQYDVETIEQMESKFTDLEKPNMGWMEKIRYWDSVQQTQLHTQYPLWNLDEHFGDDVDWKWGYAIWDDDTLDWAKSLDFPIARR